MIQKASSVCVVLFGLVLSGSSPDAWAQAEPGGDPHGFPNAIDPSLHGPGGVYAKIPARDDLGRDQLVMFRAWNPDPVGSHEANLRALNPVLASVVRKAQDDIQGQRFVIGSGKRDGRLQRMAVTWGWSRTQDSMHRSGNAVDLWPLDRDGRVIFDRTAQSRIAEAMKRAAMELGVALRWGGHFQSFKNADRSHFELAVP
ncbi:M15 family metallopeptidase [Microvirga mediterraneensis]|uniref:M15 family metallopeptidase n=1 Tax=Microvirga mediterraneensis TaxID=2754695 RepID=A0A838BJ71_9HYPH|nr:M15 family metallopeptidase [Microvirga mediterraneensis]MBA1155644.1 M15 family metallopeptidase [Microvirga mediterraneensis]